MHIRIFSDFNCPFCWLGSQILSALRNEFSFTEEWLPFELHPDIPREGRDLLETYLEEEIEAAYDELNARGAAFGLSYTPSTVSRNSALALQAGEFAKEAGLFQPFHQAVYRAYFTDARDISSREVIMLIAEDIGLDAAALTCALDEGRYASRLTAVREEAARREITVAPTFVVDDEHLIVGAQALPLFRQQLEAVKLNRVSL